MTDTALFDKYGGFASISRVVLAFYDRLLDSDDIGPFFDDIDMSRMVDHQTKFMASLLGGPASYTDSQIRQFHRHLAIADSHFDELKTVLSESLADHGFEAGDIEAVLAAYEERRTLVVG